MIAKLQQLAIYDVSAPAGTPPLVLSSIQDGVDGAGGFFYTEEEDLLTIEDDQNYLLSMLCRVDIRVLGEGSKRATLMAMVGKECVISGVGIDGFFQFGRVTSFSGGVATAVDTVKIVAADQVDKSTVFRIVAQKRSTKAYVNGVMAGGVLASENMMAIYELEAGTSSLLNGMFITGGTSLRTGAVMEVTYASLLANAFIGTSGFYLYPFLNAPVFYSLIRNGVAGNVGANTLKLLGYDATSTLTTIASNATFLSGTRTYVGGNVPVGNVFIAATYELTTIQAGSVMRVQQPMIGRLNPQTYTKY
jgi:hypothetical protein